LELAPPLYAGFPLTLTNFFGSTYCAPNLALALDAVTRPPLWPTGLPRPLATLLTTALLPCVAPEISLGKVRPRPMRSTHLAGRTSKTLALHIGQRVSDASKPASPSHHWAGPVSIARVAEYRITLFHSLPIPHRTHSHGDIHWSSPSGKINVTSPCRGDGLFPQLLRNEPLAQHSG